MAAQHPNALPPARVPYAQRPVLQPRHHPLHTAATATAVSSLASPGTAAAVISGMICSPKTAIRKRAGQDGRRLASGENRARATLLPKDTKWKDKWRQSGAEEGTSPTAAHIQTECGVENRSTTYSSQWHTAAHCRTSQAAHNGVTRTASRPTAVPGQRHAHTPSSDGDVSLRALRSATPPHTLPRSVAGSHALPRRLLGPHAPRKLRTLPEGRHVRPRYPHSGTSAHGTRQALRADVLHEKWCIAPWWW